MHDVQPRLSVLAGFAPLAERYDGFILDLWGVVHDGVQPYPGAVDCLARMKAAGKRSVLLSNAPRRAAAAQAAMRAMGIADDLYDGILTSGEATHLALRDRDDPWFAALGTRVFHLGPERDRNVIEGLPLTRVGTPAEADFVLNTGPDDHQSGQSVADFASVLGACHAAKLPMICANPDLEVIRGGVRVICAGALAQEYAAMGGDVRSLGKPDPAIYPRVFALLGLAPDRILAVGDALRTDIAGAKAVGIASAWVLGGIHAEELGLAEGELPDAAAATARAAADGLSPTAVLPAFRW
ncbi:TIGR01459 family HAD-type hydrolase [Elioraea sp.]|uniref:TIGR01459 family HAD-type hydrolase n=1 Tax=Elioraea sp. TaxID=2185103 RepID=UPI0025BCF48F|nr:TIGR01459 family HAD-type hydrolase [Elioraea sp.]